MILTSYLCSVFTRVAVSALWTTRSPFPHSAVSNSTDRTDNPPALPLMMPHHKTSGKADYRSLKGLLCQTGMQNARQSFFFFLTMGLKRRWQSKQLFTTENYSPSLLSAQDTCMAQRFHLLMELDSLTLCNKRFCWQEIKLISDVFRTGSMFFFLLQLMV